MLRWRWAAVFVLGLLGAAPAEAQTVFGPCTAATTSLLGCVKPDGTSITVTGGTISAPGGTGNGMATSGANATSGALDAIATAAGQTGGLNSTDNPTFGTLTVSTSISTVGNIQTSGTGAGFQGLDRSTSGSFTIYRSSGTNYLYDSAGGNVLAWQAGVQVGAPTGGDKGSGTLNLAGLLYNNGTAPTGSGGGYVLAGVTALSSLVTVSALTGGSIASGFGTIATANTISTSAALSTTLSTDSTSGSTGALQSSGGIGAVKAIWAGSFFAASGTTLPGQAGGTLGIGGEQAAPTLGANGEADIFLVSTTGGLGLIGQGSSNDFTLYNKNGSAALVLPTGTTIPSTPGLTVTGSSTPTNGVYLPVASTAGLVGASAIELVIGSTDKMDYQTTTANTWTLAAPTTVNSATFKVTTLATSTAIDTVCYTTATGLFTEEPTGTTCTVSDERMKTAMQPISRRHSLDIILRSSPISYYYKPELQDPDYHLGFGAQTLAKVAPELVQRDAEGVPNAVKQLELLPITWAGMQAMQAEIDDLKWRLGLR